MTDGLDGIVGIAQSVIGEIRDNPLATIGSVAVGGAVVGAVIGGIVASKAKTGSSNRKKRRRITHTKRGWKQDRARRSKQKWEVAYQKRKKKHHKKSRSRKGIHYTKNGQPYKILANGRARFIKK